MHDKPIVCLSVGGNNVGLVGSEKLFRRFRKALGKVRDLTSKARCTVKHTTVVHRNTSVWNGYGITILYAIKQ